MRKRANVLRRIGVLHTASEDNLDGQAHNAAFLQQQLGWSDLNVRIDTRWAAGDADRIRKYPNLA
jgi:hypothetical protein